MEQKTNGGESFASRAEENRNRNIEEYQARKIELDSFPWQVQIGADNRCNLRCAFCLADAYRQKGMIHLQDRKIWKNPINLFKSLVPWMPYWKMLSLTGPGESLINPKISQVIRMVSEHSGCDLVVTTNGVLINQRLTDIFLDCGLTEVSISMDSLDPGIYSELRVNGKLSKVLRGIKFIKDEKERRGSELPRINITPTFFRRNIEELPYFVDFASANGIHQLQASPGQVYREDWLGESLLGFPELTRKMARIAEEKAEKLGVRFINNLKMVYINRGNPLLKLFRRESREDLPTDPSTCMKPWSSLYVEPDGEVRPCCYQSPVLGNLYQESFEKIWNGEAAQALRQSMNDRNPPRPCVECYEFNRHRPEIMIALDAVKEEDNSLPETRKTS